MVIFGVAHLVIWVAGESEEETESEEEIEETSPRWFPPRSIAENTLKRRFAGVFLCHDQVLLSFCNRAFFCFAVTPTAVRWYCEDRLG